MGRYYITNGEGYLTCSNDSSIIIGGPISQAKRFKEENAIATIKSLNSDKWCVQKYFSSNSGKNYIITNATKFVGDNNIITNTINKARPFKTAADADGYIRCHGDLLLSMGKTIIINDQYETVDIFGKKILSKTNLKKINTCDSSKKKRKSLHQDMRLLIYKRDNGICQICGKPLDVDNFTIDHIVPLNRGGVNNINNYRCVCSRCNEWKSDSLDEELTTMLEDVGSNYIYKHPRSDMATKFIRMIVRGVINQA